ncbi:hypothetical protein GOBAR_DD08205 [Gossypium barbadense]|nr:hypothetical protein GOBAR_DD08205 [Gossypium barbadense]
MELSILLIMLLLFIFLSSAFCLIRIGTSPKAMEGIPGSMDFSSPSGIFSFMNKRQQRYGKVFKSFVLGRYTVFMTGREASKILLTGKDGMVSLNLFYTGQQVLGPNSLLQTNGEAHKRLRRLIAEPLSIDGLKKYFHFINTQAIETLDQWTGKRVLVLEEASSVEFSFSVFVLSLNFTLKVIGNMIMSLEPSGEEQERFRANFKIISSSFASMPFKIPGTAFHRGIKARDSMYAMIDSIIAKRRNGEVIQRDFLESLIIKHSKGTNTIDNEDNKLTDQQMKDNILTLLVAGHDTTTAALTWLVKFLGENPAVLEQLRDEHLQIQANRKDGTNLTWSEVNNMPYTNKVISETLRRATILPWYSRKAAQDFEIDGYNIKKGWSINLDVVSIHHDPETFPDPEKFDPSRFDAPLKTFSYLGFGSGPRMCPGMNLAKLEICIFIHHLVCKYKWRALEKDDSVQPTLVRMPKNKYPIMVEPL